MFIDVASGNVKKVAKTGKRSWHAAITPDGKYGVISNADSASLTVLDVASQTSVAQVRLPKPRPFSVAVSRDSSFAYVSTLLGGGQIHVVKLDGAASKVVKSIPIGKINLFYGAAFVAMPEMEVSPDGSTLAVCVNFDDKLVLFDTATQSKVAEIAVGSFPMRVSFTPDSKRVFVSNVGDGSVAVVSVAGAASKVDATIKGVIRPFELEVDSAGDYVYVGGTRPNKIYVIATRTNTVVKELLLSLPVRDLYLLQATSELLVATSSAGLGPLVGGGTSGELVTIKASGASSAIVDAEQLSSTTSELTVSEPLKKVLLTLPIPDGFDRFSY